MVADTIDGSQFSGHRRPRGLRRRRGLRLEDRSLVCLPSTYRGAEGAHSRIVPAHPAGAVITTPRHQIDAVVTEYGVAELQGKTVHQRGEALAAVAHPDARDGLLAAAARASGGRSPLRE